MNRRPVFLITVLCFGFAFFYIPILSMMVYSFNASRLATVWGGFSTKWYVALFNNDQVIRAAILSGWLLAFTISLDDVVITNFTTGPGNTTLPLLIWSKVKLGVTPDINALATITVLLVGIGVATAGFILNRAEKRRDRDARMAYRANE